MARVWDWLQSISPEAWAAGAAWLTALVAIVASVAAFHQVREARKLREEQAQPYVVAYMEPSKVDGHLIEFVVKNFGSTVARDVRLKSEPAMRRSAGRGSETEVVELFDVLPVLVPQQEWRTFWDAGIERQATDLPDRHHVYVSYRDSRGRDMPETEAVLDWRIYKGRMWAKYYGVHDVAKALREIKASVESWTEPTGRGISVYRRSGHKKDKRQRKMLERRETLKRISTSLKPALEDAHTKEPMEDKSSDNAHRG